MSSDLWTDAVLCTTLLTQSRCGCLVHRIAGTKPRTRKYKSGERNPLLRSRGLLGLDGEGGGEDFRETHDGGVRGSSSIGGLETEHQAVMDVVVSGSPAAFRIAPKITTAPREAARVLATRGVGQAEEEDPSPALQEAVTGVRGRRLKQDSGAVFLPFPTPAPETRPCACAHYIGEVGPAPKERGYWFQRERVDDVRARIDALCGDIYRRWRHGYSPETEGEDQGPGVAANSRWVRLKLCPFLTSVVGCGPLEYSWSGSIARGIFSAQALECQRSLDTVVW